MNEVRLQSERKRNMNKMHFFFHSMKTVQLQKFNHDVICLKSPYFLILLNFESRYFNKHQTLVLYSDVFKHRTSCAVNYLNEEKLRGKCCRGGIFLPMRTYQWGKFSTTKDRDLIERRVSYCYLQKQCAALALSLFPTNQVKGGEATVALAKLLTAISTTRRKPARQQQRFSHSA